MADNFQLMKIHNFAFCFFPYPRSKTHGMGTLPSKIAKAIEFVNNDILSNSIRRLASVAIKMAKLALDE